MSDIFVSFLQFYIYGNTLYNWNTLYTLNNILLCLIVVGGHFEQNSQEFSLGSILLYPSTIRHKTVLNLFCYICESIYWNILKRLYSDDNIPWYLLNVFCCIYYKDYIYWNIFEPLKVLEYVEKYDKNKKCFFSKFTVSHDECK